MRTHDNEAEYSKQYWRARAGLDLWMKATYGNANDLKKLDWFEILRTDQRGKTRWEKWGLLSDPDCCTPGKNCSEKYPGRVIPDLKGYDYCPGDETMATSSDPACDFRDQDGQTRAERGETFDTLTRTACHLQFGWSSGAIGIRKFPNPISTMAGQPARPFVFGVACALVTRDLIRCARFTL